MYLSLPVTGLRVLRISEMDMGTGRFTDEDLARMREMRSAGVTHAKIGEEFGVTPQYISHLLGPLPDGTPTRASKRRAQLVAEIEAWLDDNGPSTLSEVFDAVGATDTDRVAVRSLLPKHRFVQSKRVAERYSDDDMLQALRDVYALEEGWVLSETRYERQRDPDKHPSLVSVQGRFGSWAAACALAGVPSGTIGSRVYAREWSDEKIVAAVKEYLIWCAERNLSPTYRRYDEEWQVDRAAPCGTLIRRRFNTGWPGVLKAVNSLSVPV